MPDGRSLPGEMNSTWNDRTAVWLTARPINSLKLALPRLQRLLHNEAITGREKGAGHFLEEMSTAEVAECLEITEEVVKMRLLRARRMLRRALYELARVTGSKAFEFGGERCNHVTKSVATRISGVG